MNSQFNELLKLFPGKIALIKTDKSIVFSNDSKPHGTENLPCHKFLFNSETVCSFCFFFDRKGGTHNFLDKNFTKKAQIKLPDINESEFEDFYLNQSVIEIENENLIFDAIYENNVHQKTDVNDQLTTLGAHVQTVAHELSNPITGLNLTLQKLDEIVNTESSDLFTPVKSLIGLLKKDILRATEVISEIRTFSRPVSTSYKILDLKQLIKSAADNAVRTSSRKDVRVTFKWNIPKDLNISGNPMKLERCFINILKNSFDMFSIRPQIKNPEISISTDFSKTDNSATIQIIDNAGGISNTVLKNVFRPYFTTKEKFQGLGLGLYIAGKILKEHHSTISIESKGENTQVLIKIPQNNLRK